MTPEELRENLQDLADNGYREFHLRTCPQAQHLLGVRLPAQRKLTKQIIKSGDYWQFLDSFTPYYYEEVMITGIIIASAPMGLAERLDYVAWFLPYINNWAVCDTFCNSFKIPPIDLDKYWDFLMQFQDSQEEYTLRFIFVMLLCHFINLDYLERIFQLLDEIHCEKHYVEMAKAWLIAEIFTKFPNQTYDYLSHDQLSTFAHNKAIQKVCESRRIFDADKQHLRSMKL